MEQALCKNTSLSALLNSPTKASKGSYSGSTVIGNTLKIWHHIRRYIKAPCTYLDSPICKNHAFSPGLSDSVFLMWQQRGINDLNALYVDGAFASFAQLQSLYSIPMSNLFRYFQIREFTRKHTPNYQNIPRHEILDIINKFNPLSRGSVSYFYKALLALSHTDTSAHRQAWALELNEEISEVFWDQCLANVNDCSVNTRHNLIQFNTIHRLYYRKTKIHRFAPTTSPLCNRCKIAEGTLAHTFWSCTKLSSYRTDIFHCYSRAYRKTWSPSPLVAVLCGMGALPLSNTYEAQAVSVGMVVARKIILRMWTSDSAPTYEMWLREMGNVLHLEKIRYNDRLRLFNKIWDPLLMFINGED